ncbi:MAG: Pr6Pr family membrane protein [Microbacteriaceae bacterium]|nr:Pr6Pr family membrane protein [Microbacteriaceae bacterium]
MSQKAINRSSNESTTGYQFIGYLRLIVGLVIVAALIFQAWKQVEVGAFNSLDFFTNLGAISALIFGAVIGYSGFLVIVGEVQDFWMQLVRPAATALVLSALVMFVYSYSDLVVAVEFLQWQGVVIFLVAPIYALIDWLIVDDRAALRGGVIGLFLVLPVIWIFFVITRGLSDGWTPFPLFKPEEGFGQLALASGIYLVMFIVVAIIVVMISKLSNTLIRSGKVY